MTVHTAHGDTEYLPLASRQPPASP